MRTIIRRNDKNEVDVAVSELIARGFTLIREGVSQEDTRAYFNNFVTRKDGLTLGGACNSNVKYYAILERKKPVEMAVSTGG